MNEHQERFNYTLSLTFIYQEQAYDDRRHVYLAVLVFVIFILLSLFLLYLLISCCIQINSKKDWLVKQCFCHISQDSETLLLQWQMIPASIKGKHDHCFMSGVLKRRTAVPDPDHQDVFGGPRPFRA